MPRRRTERATEDVDAVPKSPVGADAAKRVARTGAQLAIPTLIVQGYNLFTPPERHLTSEQTNWIIAVGTLLIGFIQNLLEEEGVISGFLKGPATDLNARKFEALAAAIGSAHNNLERLENEIRDLRADRGYLDPAGFQVAEDPARISTRQLEPEEVPFRG